MYIVWMEDDATPGTEGHITLSAAFKIRYNEEWSKVRETATNKVDHGDCMIYTLPDGREICESYPGENQISEPEGYPQFDFNTDD